VWRRLTAWAAAGVFDQLHLEILDRLGERGRVDWSRASVDTISIRAKPGTTWAQIQSIAASLDPSCTWSATAVAALTVAVTAANVNDTRMFAMVLNDVPPIRTPSGRRRTRPEAVHADKTSHAVRCQAGVGCCCRGGRGNAAVSW
jgi:hypothetical protein